MNDHEEDVQTTTETRPPRIRWDLVVNNDLVLGLSLTTAVVVVIVTFLVTVTTNVRESNEHKADKRVAEVQACRDIEDADERIICLWSDKHK